MPSSLGAQLAQILPLLVLVVAMIDVYKRQG